MPSSDALHVDVMDNHFVPNLTLGLPVVKSIRKITDKMLDIHLMIEQPDRWAPAYAEAGAESVTFHVEAAGAPVRLARELRSRGARAAMALKPATPIEPYEDLLPELDMVLIMTVEPGFGGQSFLDLCLPKIARTRAMLDKLGGDIWLQIDGGVSAETMERCAAAGVDSFVAGSSVFAAADPDAMVAAARPGGRRDLTPAELVRTQWCYSATAFRQVASQLTLAAAQIALELRRDRIAARLRQLRCVLHLLQRGDILGDLGVLGRQLVYATLPRAGQLGQLTKIEGGVEHPLQLGQQRKRCLRARRMRDVVRDCRPECEDLHSSSRQGLAQNADDAGRTLIRRWRQAKLFHQLAVGGRHRYRDRAGVRSVGKQRAQQVDPRDVGRAERRRDHGAELAPPQIGLQAFHQDQVTAVGQLSDLQFRGGPADLALIVLGECHLRSVDLKVVEVVWVERVHRLGLVGLGEMLDGTGCRVPCVVPATEGHHNHRVDQIAKIAGGRAGGVGHGLHCSRRLGNAISLHIVVGLPRRHRMAIILTRCPMACSAAPPQFPRSDLRATLSERVVIADGAMGTMLQGYDLTLEDFQQLEGCNEILNLTRPDIVRAIHDAYFEVGVDAVETNTFGANLSALGEYGIADKITELAEAGARIARESADAHSTSDRPRWVLGSVGPGTKLPTLGHVSYARLRDAYQQQIEGLIAGGVDAVLIETSQDLLQTKAATLGAKRALAYAGRDLPVIVHVTVETTGTMLLGSEIGAALTALEPLGIDLIGLNCATGPAEMSEHLRHLSRHAQIGVSCMPNAGLPQLTADGARVPATAGRAG